MHIAYFDELYREFERLSGDALTADVATSRNRRPRIRRLHGLGWRHVGGALVGLCLAIGMAVIWSASNGASPSHAIRSAGAGGPLTWGGPRMRRTPMQTLATLVGVPNAPWTPGFMAGTIGVSSASLSSAEADAPFAVALPTASALGAASAQPSSVLVASAPGAPVGAVQSVILVYPNLQVTEQPQPGSWEPQTEWQAMVDQQTEPGNTVGSVDGVSAYFGPGYTDSQGTAHPAYIDWVSGGILYTVEGYRSIATLDQIADSIGQASTTSTK